MDRKGKLLSGLDLQHSVGLEIGALCRPFLKRSDGPVLYVDHADTATLRKKYENDADVDLDKLVEVDAVWGVNTLKEALKNRSVDYIVASHVIEHVPDLIGWLGELASVLGERGEVRLIVPDKRFTFDYLRRETQLADVLYAFLIHARHPPPHIVLDYVMNVTKIDCAKAWRDEIDRDSIEFHHSVDHAIRVARDVIENNAYHDVHCWVFTPKSFAALFRELAERGFIDFRCSQFHLTEHDQLEFFVGLQLCNDRAAIVQSWRNFEDSVPDVEQAKPDPELELLRSTIAHLENTNTKFQDLVRESRGEIDELKTRLTHLRSERDSAKQDVKAISNSTSWKVTQPLRLIKRALTRAH